MFGKRTRVLNDEATPGKRLRSNFVDLWANGDVSASRAVSLLKESAAAGVSACATKSLLKSNVEAKTLVRALLKDSRWPPVYTTRIPLRRSGVHNFSHADLRVLFSVSVSKALFRFRRAFARLLRRLHTIEAGTSEIMNGTAILSLFLSMGFPLLLGHKVGSTQTSGTEYP